MGDKENYVQIYMQREEHQVREKEIQGHELERTRGASTETDRGQGASCAPEAPRENSTRESQVQRRVRKHMGYKQSPFPKATRRKNIEQ